MTYKDPTLILEITFIPNYASYKVYLWTYYLPLWVCLFGHKTYFRRRKKLQVIKLQPPHNLFIYFIYLFFILLSTSHFYFKSTSTTSTPHACGTKRAYRPIPKSSRAISKKKMQKIHMRNKR